MDGCLTEYFQRVTYVDFFKRTIVVGRELPFSSFQLEYFCGRQLVISDGSDDVAFKVNGDQMSRVNSGLKPHQPGNDKNRAGSMAMWVAPIRMYDHLSREIPIASLSIRC